MGCEGWDHGGENRDRVHQDTPRLQTDAPAGVVDEVEEGDGRGHHGEQNGRLSELRQAHAVDLARGPITILFIATRV